MQNHPESSFDKESGPDKPSDVDLVNILGEMKHSYLRVLTPSAIQFLFRLHQKFESLRETLLLRRKLTQSGIDAGVFPEFLAETKDLREAEWTVASIPNELLDRRVEITGPVDRKRVINALNSGAQVYMADFEDSHSPTWGNTLEGQINLQDAVRRTLSYTSPDGKQYRLNEAPAILFVRPRGWHLVEKHF